MLQAPGLPSSTEPIANPARMVITACSALKRAYRDILRGEQDPQGRMPSTIEINQDQIRTCLIYRECMKIHILFHCCCIIHLRLHITAQAKSLTWIWSYSNGGAQLWTLRSQRLQRVDWEANATKTSSFHGGWNARVPTSNAGGAWCRARRLKSQFDSHRLPRISRCRARREGVARYCSRYNCSTKLQGVSLSATSFWLDVDWLMSVVCPQRGYRYHLSTIIVITEWLYHLRPLKLLQVLCHPSNWSSVQRRIWRRRKKPWKSYLKCLNPSIAVWYRFSIKRNNRFKPTMNSSCCVRRLCNVGSILRIKSTSWVVIHA